MAGAGAANVRQLHGTFGAPYGLTGGRLLDNIDLAPVMPGPSG